MNGKVYWIGLGGGVLASISLFYPLYYFLPGKIISGWHPSNGILAGFTAALSILFVLDTGALAARLSGLSKRFSGAAAGGLSGMLAGFLTYILIINPASGVWASRELLAHGLEPYNNASTFFGFLADEVLSIISLGYLTFWASILGGFILGFFGGMAVKPSGAQGDHLLVLGVPMSIAGLLSAGIVFVLSSSTFNILAGVTEQAAGKFGHTLLYPASFMIYFAAGTSYLYLLTWQVLAYLAYRKASKKPVNRPVSWDVSAILNALAPFLVLGVGLKTTYLLDRAWIAASGSVISAGISVLSILLFWRNRRMPRPALHARIPARWLLAGGGVLFLLTIVGLYFGGAGPSITITMIPIAMLPNLIPLDQAAAPYPLVTGGLSGLVRANYLATTNPGIKILVPIVLIITISLLITWLVDWYGLRFAAWILSSIRRSKSRSTQAS